MRVFLTIVHCEARVFLSQFFLIRFVSTFIIKHYMKIYCDINIIFSTFFIASSMLQLLAKMAVHATLPILF